MTLEEAYRKGFVEGLQAFAWWKEGAQYVGTTGTTLKQALAGAEKLWSWHPPRVEHPIAGDMSGWLDGKIVLFDGKGRPHTSVTPRYFEVVRRARALEGDVSLHDFYKETH